MLVGFCSRENTGLAIREGTWLVSVQDGTLVDFCQVGSPRWDLSGMECWLGICQGENTYWI